ncbi:actin-like ATPase domain-containing protein [Aspergillus japonicus CBS 114.51]|uniref:Actin-like ATPase domain-containing protein n=1 Tax=Aspergillus japonicus CBS 114.51 TaxID=1448312 RepID=A0A8T8WY86_ASPJA|nr:actin-like ATPase domain-containing protein [Aspergillus japonicus CBS 114.51]RAH80826.1 actin-like ATPase domain-containing protein [Aspergillus japonicus CBS 114.51]
MGKAIYAVVGIDFGTTYSGVAWALEGNPEDIEIISSWPGGGNRTTLKVPSVISYENKVSKWGYQVGPLSEVIRGSKLLLDEHQDQEYAPSLESKPLLVKYGKDAVQVSGDYLKNLVVHVKDTLERRFGESAKSMELIYVLTVPAVWSDKAKDATLRAAFLAGVDSSQVSLVSEPEAAALHSLRTIQPNSISKEDVLIVCDAGGGTVDLISYKVRDIAPLDIEEVTEGTGAVCGSLLLDERFERLLMRKVGLENWQCLRTQSKESALSYWRDMVKPNFGEESECDYLDVDHFIPLPGAESQPDKHIEAGFVQLDSNEIEEIFEPIVLKVEELVRMQLERVADLGLKVKAIVLVGGFGSSRYLFQRLKTKNPSIPVMQPPNAWAAVVSNLMSGSGAVSRGLEGNRVEARVSRRSYGVSANKKFDQSRHAKHAKYWSHTEQEWFARDNMTWYIKKSARVSEHQPIKFDFYRTVFVDQADELRFTDELFFCNDKSPPDIKCGRVIPLCTLNSDLSKIPRQLFRRKKNSSGNEYYEITYTLKVTPASASLLFDLEFNGVSYGSVSSRY